jgi:excisionase family DNA binding protein
MSSGTEYERLLTPAQVAACFSVDTKTVSRWAKKGLLTSIRTLGGHRRYRESEVRALLAGTPERPPDPLAAPVHTLWPAAVSGPGLVVRNRAIREGIATVGALTGHSAEDLRDLGFTAAQVDEVRLALYRKGLALKGDVLGNVA